MRFHFQKAASGQGKRTKPGHLGLTEWTWDPWGGALCSWCWGASSKDGLWDWDPTSTAGSLLCVGLAELRWWHWFCKCWQNIRLDLAAAPGAEKTDRSRKPIWRGMSLLPPPVCRFSLMPPLDRAWGGGSDWQSRGVILTVWTPESQRSKCTSRLEDKQQ